MRKPKLLKPNTIEVRIDDSDLEDDLAREQAKAQSVGLDGCCRQLADFGMNEQQAWRWIQSHFEDHSFREFRRAYQRARKAVGESSLVKATVTEAGPGGTMIPGHYWLVEIAAGRTLRAIITDKFNTTKIPTLQIGDIVKVRVHTSDEETCSIDQANSPVKWVDPMKLSRKDERD